MAGLPQGWLPRALLFTTAGLLLLGVGFILLGLWAVAAWSRGAGGDGSHFWFILPVGAFLLAAYFQMRRHAIRPYPREALDLMGRAGEGDPEACFRLGAAYASGSGGVPRDDVSARFWLTRAAQAGQTEAMVPLADLLEAGRGGRRDPAGATAWRTEAGPLGHPRASAERIRLTRRAPRP